MKKFKKTILASAMVMASGSTLAADLESMEATLRTLQAQVANLQAQLAEQKATVAKVSQEHAAHGPGADAEHDAHGHGDWTKGISISGVVEASMARTDVSGGEDTESFNLDTVELEIHSHLTEFAEAEVVLLYEDGSDPADNDELTVDAATITFTPAFMGPFAFTIGKDGVPLTSGETMGANDPYNMDFADFGGQRIAQLGFEMESGLYGSLTAFRAEGTGNSDGGAELGYAFEGEDLSADIAVAYVNDLRNNDVDLKETINYRAMVATGPWTGIAEYTVGDGIGGAADTKATNLELGYGFRVGDMDNNFAVAWRKLDDASGNVTENVTEKKAKVAALTLGVAENAAVILEYLDDDHSGSAAEDSNTATAKFVYEF
ncbi:MAG: hypothetical protein ACO376_04910, partial [Gammaproteobacteria bacterium]